ncbi:transporter [Paenibacillus sp. JX-17]|uniref:Transporter n=1 Tax=Paenibacillus lacisoli TaxID=3064525 RepID=A0ABT9CC23_9BACL|nr:transporter [Paenibacillus sp. JX-17]MDO7906787.1 transporter [Paenibacillus sp. JX-17]
MSIFSPPGNQGPLSPQGPFNPIGGPGGQGPVGPQGPFNPPGPAGGPGGGPIGPLNPPGPVGPVGPLGPQGPFNPFGPVFPSPGPGPGPGPGSQQPSSPPPSFIPPKPLTSVYAVDPGAIAGCLFRNTFVWLRNGQRFWFYPVFVGRNSVAGFRWNGFFWTYLGVDLNQIESFTCY